MNSIRNGIIYLISWFAVKIPFLFSRRVKYAAESFFYHRSDECILNRECRDVKTYSLIDPRLKWKAKAVSRVFTLSSEDAKQILKWKSSSEAFRKVDTSISVLSNATLNLGWFEVSAIKRNPMMKASLGVENDYVESCEAHLIGLEGGKYYLSVYWFLTKEATALLKDADVSQLPTTTVSYLTCNPFSKRYGMSSHGYKLGEADKLIGNNLNIIYQGVKATEKALKKLINLKSDPISVTTLDIHVDDKSPYFIKFNDKKTNFNHEDKKPQKQEKIKFNVDEVAINRYKKSFGYIGNTEDKEFYDNSISRYNSNFDLFYIKSQVTSEVDEHGFNDFGRNSLHANDSHLIFSFLCLAKKSLKNLDAKYSDYILSSYKDPSKCYKNLYHAYIEASRIEEEIKSVLKSKHMFGFWGAGKYLEKFTLNTEYFFKEVSSLKAEIEFKKRSSNELVESENLRYQKRMSVLVTLLALLQLFVAVISLNSTAFEAMFSNWSVKASSILQLTISYFRA